MREQRKTSKLHEIFTDGSKNLSLPGVRVVCCTIAQVNLNTREILTQYIFEKYIRSRFANRKKKRKYEGTRLKLNSRFRAIQHEYKLQMLSKDQLIINYLILL